MCAPVGSEERNDPSGRTEAWQQSVLVSARKKMAAAGVGSGAAVVVVVERAMASSRVAARVLLAGQRRCCDVRWSWEWDDAGCASLMAAWRHVRAWLAASPPHAAAAAASAAVAVGVASARWGRRQRQRTEDVSAVHASAVCVRPTMAVNAAAPRPRIQADASRRLGGWPAE